MKSQKLGFDFVCIRHHNSRFRAYFFLTKSSDISEAGPAGVIQEILHFSMFYYFYIQFFGFPDVVEEGSQDLPWVCLSVYSKFETIIMKVSENRIM